MYSTRLRFDVCPRPKVSAGFTNVSSWKSQHSILYTAPCLSYGLSLSLSLVSSRRKVVIGYWPIRSITRVKYHQLTWYNSLWLWRWLPHRLSKRHCHCQQQSYLGLSSSGRSNSTWYFWKIILYILSFNYSNRYDNFCPDNVRTS